MKKVSGLVGAIISALLLATAPERGEAAVASPAEILQEAQALFAEANEAALSDPAEGARRYDEAALHFQYLIDEHGIENELILANVGNAYFFGGDLGRAILNYRRALKFAPGHREIRENLAHARAQRVDVFEAEERAAWVEWLFFWHYKLGRGVRVALFALAWAAIWCLLGWRVFLPQAGTGLRAVGRQRFRQGLAVCGIVVLLMGISLAISGRGAGRGGDGVIVATEVDARKGDGFIYEPAFATPLHAGTEFALLESRGNWLQVAFESGEKAWLPRESVALLSPEA